VLVTGLVAVFFGPLEMYCFYLFSEGGAFHYEGFRFGTFMFGNLAAQIMGYYFIAAVLLPFGYGLMRLRSWARHLALALLQFWIVAGLPLVSAFFFVLLGSKELAWPVVLLAGVLAAASYVALPGLAIRFFNHPGTKRCFQEQEQCTWLERIPVPVLGLGYVEAFFVLILHAQIYFNSIFPLFGRWVTGLWGIVWIDLAILSTLALLWATIRLKRWAWWGLLSLFGLMTCSYSVTLLSSSWMDILAALNLPAYELAFLQGVPIHGFHLAILAGIPFLLVLILILRTRPYFIARPE